MKLDNGTVESFMTSTTYNGSHFDFRCVPPGKYVLVEYNPNGFDNVGDSEGGDPNTIVIDVTDAGDSPNNRFVNAQLLGFATVSAAPTKSGIGCISGNVGDDVVDKDLQGVLVILKDGNGNIVAREMPVEWRLISNECDTLCGKIH